ncbi:MAG: oligosaccharide flippase family protein [Anaerolineae bacterium]|nr:oligosaccharide flippase family protein [Anaerolineae bacterium]
MSPSLPGYHLTRNTLIKLTSEFVGRAASFLLMIMAARQLGAAAFGWYNYGLALGFVLAQLADMGLQLLISREVAVHQRQAQFKVQTAFYLKLLLTLPVIFLLLLLTRAYDPPIRLSLFLIGCMLLSQTYLEFIGYVFRGQQMLAQEAWLLAGARLILAVGGGIVLALGGGLLALSSSGLLLMLLVTGIGLAQLIRLDWLYFPKGNTPLSSALTVFFPGRVFSGRGVMRGLLTQAWPLGIAIFLSIAYTRLGVLLLQHRLDETAVAHFSAAARLVEPMQIIPASLLAAAFPVLAVAWQQDPARAKRLGWQLGLLLAGCALLLAGTGWVAAARLIPWLYGEGYGAAVPLFKLLLLTLLPAFLNFSLTHHLIARHQQRHIVWYMGIMLLIHAGLTWMLLPRLGAIAPAISMIVAEIFLFITCLGTLRIPIEEYKATTG